MLSKSVFLLVAILAVSAQSAEELQPKFSLNQLLANRPVLNNIINNPQIQAQISAGLNQFQGYEKQVPPRQEAPGPVDAVIPGELLQQLNVTTESLKFYTDLLVLNLNFFVERLELSSTEKNAVLQAIPKLIAANNQQDVVDAIEPLIFSGFIVFFEDPYIIFEDNPYQEAARRFLTLFFASPQAPEFLADPQVQAQVLAYVDQLFASSDLTVTFNSLMDQLNQYLMAATTQELKPYIAQYLPELYNLIKNENDFTTIVTISYQYAITNSVQLYSLVMGIVMPLISGQQSDMMVQGTKLLASLNQLVEAANKQH